MDIEPTVNADGWTLAELPDGRRVDVMVMLYNDRVVISDPDGMTYGRYWCYPKGGAAFHAVALWDFSDDSEPVGWIKSWDGRYTEAGVGQRGVDGKIAVPAPSHSAA